MRDACFALLPRDGLSAKDGRGWYTSEVGRGYSLPWPLPTTVRGALRAAWGHDVMADSGTALSPEAWEHDSEPVKLQRLVALRRVLGATSFRQAHRMWPAPADAARVLDTEGVERQVRLEPHPGGASTLGPDDDDAREALWHPRRSASGKPLPAPLFWPESRMVAWLSGAPDASTPEREAPPPRTDIHLAIDVETQAKQDSMLHSREVVECLRVQSRDAGRLTLEEWALGVSCAWPDLASGLPRGPLGLGGRRRLSDVERLDGGLFAMPEGLAQETRGLRLVLATPAEFQRGWLPDGFERVAGAPPRYVGRLPGVEAQVVLRAALVPRPLEVSGWDMVRRRPRPTRRWVPAGAVYFFEKHGGGDFTANELRALWLASWGGGHAEALGQVLPGVWQPPRDGQGA
ncbi:type III-B CRISPR module-associated Cmr3 family protein [Corallococcus macrosporus]|uniref:Putative CRISPR-associated Crm3 family protein n=1 Tax=Myxococcus fulvus (strain ATCC BAA-855 / HW-1) TaxID=483219 RepID=F8CKZ9_MYXFH|nr:type III-B CRISPR module-associated Cmr3 family protein [Corallococcus macrosporus]AEI63912.1 putative CRISPR-associated Crm3 family protein [Corallococcus macrosporus]